MNQSDLLLRQQRLQMRSAQLRRTLASQTQVFKTPLAVADQVRAGLQWLQHNPQWPLVTVLVLVALRPRRVVVWGSRLWWTWRTFKKVRNWALSMPSLKP